MTENIVPNDILQTVSLVLGDSNRERWSESLLINLYNYAANDICIEHMPIVKRDRVTYQGEFITTDVVASWGSSATPANSILAYNMFWLGERVGQNWDERLVKPLPIYTLQEARKQLADGWEENTSDKPQFLIKFPNRRVDEIRVYPKMLPTTGRHFLAFEYADMEDLVITSNIHSILNLPTYYSQALVHHITSNAIRVNQDTQNRQFGFEEYKFYTAEMEKIAKMRQKSGVIGCGVYNVPQRNVGGSYGG